MPVFFSAFSFTCYCFLINRTCSLRHNIKHFDFMSIILIFWRFWGKTKIFKFFLFLLELFIKMFTDEVPFKLSLILLSWRRNNLGTLLLRFFCRRLSFTFNFFLFLTRSTIMTEVSIYHICVNIRVRVETSSICWIRETISLLFFVLYLPLLV